MSLLLILRSPGGGGAVATPPPGKRVLRNAKVVIAGIDVSAYCHAVTVTSERDEIDVTPIGATYKESMPGPMTGTFDVQAFYDPTVFTPAFWAALDAAPSIEVTPTGSYATSPQNPTWTATVVSVKRNTGADVGDPASTSLEFRTASDLLEQTL